MYTTQLSSAASPLYKKGFCGGKFQRFSGALRAGAERLNPTSSGCIRFSQLCTKGHFKGSPSASGSISDGFY